MWPDNAEAWYEMYEEDAVIYVRGRLTPYPVLVPFRDHLAGQGVAHARAFAHTYLRAHPRYFANPREFREWWRVRGHAEALRFALNSEPCEMVLRELPPDVRRLLLWRYVDQLRDDEVARILRLLKGIGLPFDRDQARARSLEAHQQFCRRLPQHFQPRGGANVSPQGVSSAFPLFPHEHVA
jgi:hypothetical protein